MKVEIDSDNRNYILKSSDENVTLSINDSGGHSISEGEKNLLALLFFYFELFKDNEQQRIKPEIELIIVDDPISSMDDSNKYYILALMQSLLDLKDKQVFMLTHSWEDFCNLTYGKDAKNPQSKCATFEIRKNNGKSELIKQINPEKPYIHLFKEVYSFSQKPENQIGNDCEIYHYPNVMRRVFEEWYGFRSGIILNLTSSLQPRLENDFKIKSKTAKINLSTLLKVCNILSHSNNSRNPTEIHQSAKYLMKLIQDNDELHYKSMKEICEKNA